MNIHPQSPRYIAHACDAIASRLPEHPLFVYSGNSGTSIATELARRHLAATGREPGMLLVRRASEVARTRSGHQRYDGDGWERVVFVDDTVSSGATLRHAIAAARQALGLDLGTVVEVATPERLRVMTVRAALRFGLGGE